MNMVGLTKKKKKNVFPRAKLNNNEIQTIADKNLLSLNNNGFESVKTLKTTMVLLLA